MLTARVCPRAKKWGARGLAGRALCQTAALVLTLGSSIIILEKGTEVCWPALACDRARHASSRRQPPFIAPAARSAACTSGGQCSLPRRVYMYARPPPPCQQMSAGLTPPPAGPPTRCLRSSKRHIVLEDVGCAKAQDQLRSCRVCCWVLVFTTAFTWTWAWSRACYQTACSQNPYRV
jgi:hypothetical protein